MPDPRSKMATDRRTYHSSPPSAFSIDNSGGDRELEEMEFQSPTSQRSAESSSYGHPVERSNMEMVKHYLGSTKAWMILFGLIALGLLISTVILGLKYRHQDTASSDLYPKASADSNQEQFFLNQIANDIDASRDTSKDPCSDFYEYACGNWLKNTKLPGDETRFSKSFSVIDENVRKTMQEIMQDGWPLIDAFYTSCMDNTTRTRIGIEPLSELFDMFDERLYNNTENPTTLFFHLLGKLERQTDISPLFSVQVTVNDRSPTVQWLALGQGGLSLPSRQHYLTMPVLLEKYQVHVANMLHLSGMNAIQANSTATDIVLFERAIAEFTKPPAELRDPTSLYNPFSVDTISRTYPELAWGAYFTGLEIPTKGNSGTLGTVTVPPFFSNLSSLISSTPLSHLLAHTKWQILNRFASDLSEPFAQEHFKFFGNEVHGQQARASQSKTCIARVTDNMGDLTGRYFMLRSFPGQSVATATALIHQIKNAFRESLPTYSWMDNSTRQAAFVKLQQVEDLIGGQQNKSLLVDYTKVPLQPNQYLINLLNLKALNTNVTLARLLKPTDKRIWQMTASMVNAYYEPTLNTINFPAGILQPPFFDGKYPLTLNLAGIGMVMGHELTHGFDDQGRQYDGTGTLRQWWTNTSVNEFKEHANCFEKQYGSYEYKNGTFTQHVNGLLTLGENIADNGGIHLSYKVHQNAVEKGTQELPQTSPATSADQLFFLRYAQNWCQLTTNEYIRNQLLTDPHSPAFARVNGPLSNFEPFAQAFKCPSGSPMNPVKKCSLY